MINHPHIGMDLVLFVKVIDCKIFLLIPLANIFVDQISPIISVCVCVCKITCFQTHHETEIT